MIRPPFPPFTESSARAKVQAAEDAWNTKDAALVSSAYSEDSEWRNRETFLKGRGEIQAFLTRKWNNELNYRLAKELWAYTDDRIAVRFKYEWSDETGQWWRSYGNEMWEFAADGLMRTRCASINDIMIDETERELITPAYEERKS